MQSSTVPLMFTPQLPTESPAIDPYGGATAAVRRPRVVALKNGKLGNDTHVQAIAEEIASWIDGEAEVVDARFRAPVLAPLVRRFLDSRWPERLQRSPALWNLLWRICFRGPPPCGAAPAVLCGTLARGEIPNAVLSRHWRCDNIHLGRPCRIPRHHFRAVIAPQGMAPREGDLSLEIAPTRVTLAGLQQAGAEYRREHGLEEGRLWAILIGGDGGGYRWTPDDWNRLGESLRSLAERYDVRWLITTSPRTGREVERRLQQAVPQPRIGHAVWFSERPERILQGFLGAAERTFVTEESISMLSDALVARKPLYALFPERPPTDPKAREFVDRQSAARRLQRLAVADMAGLDVTPAYDAQFQPMTHSWQDCLRDQLLPRCPTLQRLACHDQRPSGE